MSHQSSDKSTVRPLSITPTPPPEAAQEEGQLQPAEDAPPAEVAPIEGAPPAEGTASVVPDPGATQAAKGASSLATAKAAASSAPKQAAKSTTRQGYYNTNVRRKEFDFRMSNQKAKDLACGPSHQIRLHHLVLPSDHPAAAPMITEEVATIMTAKMLQKGVALKLDNRMEQSLRSLIAPVAGSKPSKSMSGMSKGPPPKTEDIAKYDGLIATLEKDPLLNSSPEKKQALEKLKNAKRTNGPMSLEEMAKILELCSAGNMIDREQAKKLVLRMQEVGAISPEQSAEIMKAVESKLIDGKIQVETLRMMIEEKGAGKKC